LSTGGLVGGRPDRLLGRAGDAQPLNDLFKDLSATITSSAEGARIQVNHLLPERTNYLQFSTNLVHWRTLFTNTLSTCSRFKTSRRKTHRSGSIA
jgi:hypothetical protein